MRLLLFEYRECIIQDALKSHLTPFIRKIKYGGSEIHLVGRKKEPLILEANKRGEMSVALGGVVNVFPGWLRTQLRPRQQGRPESGSVHA